MDPSPTRADRDLFVVRTPEDLIAMVPFVLGFHPRESLVLLTFRADGAGFHARADLPTSRAERVRLLHDLVRPVRQYDIGAAAVVVVSDDVASAGFGRLLAASLERGGAQVLDLLRVEADRWFRVRSDSEDPGVGYDVRSHPFAAASVVEGRATFADRDALVASVAPEPGEAGAHDRAEVQRSADAWLTVDRVRVELATAAQVPGAPADLERVEHAGDLPGLREDAAWLRRRLVLACESGPRPALPASAVGRLCVLARLPVLRDLVERDITRENAVSHVRLWREVTRRAPADLVEGPAAVLALAAWLAGDGALAWCAVDRCRAHAGEEPWHGQALAESVASALARAVSPDLWSQCQDPQERHEPEQPRVPRQRRPPDEDPEDPAGPAEPDDAAAS